MTNLSGTPGVDVSVTALGNIIANTVKGIICMKGPAKRGEPGKQYLHATWGDFTQVHGDEMSEDDTPLFCRHALDGGAKIRYSRIFHYTDPDDVSTVEGDLATGDIDNDAVVGVGASVQFDILTWAENDTLTLSVKDLVGNGSFELVNYTGVAAETPILAAAAIMAAVNAGTATHQYIATNPSGSTVLISKPIVLGGSGNGDIATIALVGATIENGSFKFADGTTAYDALTSTWNAAAVGSGYDGTIIDISPSSTNVDGQVDITITLPGAPLSQDISGVNRKLDARKVASLNKQMEGVVVEGLVDFTLPVGTIVLEGGTQDLSLIDDNDYKGSDVSKTGWHSFDDVVDSMRIWNVSRPTHLANQTLATYCERRKDMRSRGIFPKGLTIQGVADFRNGEGPYLHSPVDSWFMDYWHNEIYINDPEMLENPEYAVFAGGFQAALRSIADEKAGEWISDSGNDYGKLKGINGVRLNLVSPGNVGRFDSIYETGVNAVVNDEALKIVNWGNRTTLLDRTSLLSKTNIADMVVYIGRHVKRIAKKMNFKPNDVAMFNELYREVAPWVRDTLVAGRAIEGGSPDDPLIGEGTWWYWLGDQLAKDLNDLKFNKRSEVDAGKYRVRFAFKPIAANEYIQIDIAPADSITIQNVAQLNEISL